MFEDKSIDPRTCTYRLLASSKLSKQIDRLIRTKKLQFGLINPKSDSVDFYNQFHSASYSNNQNLVNRTSRNSKKKVNDENVHTDEGEKEQSTIIIAKTNFFFAIELGKYRNAPCQGRVGTFPIAH